jgi:hypothetical protein
MKMSKEYSISGSTPVFESRMKVGVSPFDPDYTFDNVSEKEPDHKDGILKITLSINLPPYTINKVFWINRFQRIDPERGIDISLT